MHIVIMGCGRVGSSLARQLARAGHSVAVIDRDPAAFRRLGADFHGQQVTGVGFDRDTLLASRIREAHCFAAVSSGDNSNIIAARVAREQFGVATVVARIYDPKRAQVYERLGIPTVATVPWTTDRLLRSLIPEGLISEWRDPSGTVSIANLPYHRDWIGRPLRELEEGIGVHVAFVVRFGNGLLPTSETVVQDGDLVYASVLAASIVEVTERSAVSPLDGV
ncbi:TrkA family potassium uptake protein [Nakamurella flavida]|uniref:Trk system potassium uptake protein TrkA n=1 Tax=Nakamurella flavida TaxID=363630 RepID=A0A938YMT8_9ACTN|nr:TrkA family potassium uptake protein [Nakamurella flavida]MBM9477446.1 TrkA family potassium uptake protein [Nakamurella flavida]MDP9777379.1 trk system potassium uptake protein TrkA [Nakamurella flavida]